MLADTRRVVRRRLAACAARLRRDCACTSYSVFKEPTRPRRALAIPDAHSPRLAGPDQPRIGRIQGNLLRLLQPLPTVNRHPAQSAEPRLRKRQSQSGRRCGLGGTFRPAVRPGSPETRELGDYERRRRNLILRAEEGLVNPAPRRAITHAETASHTAGQPHADADQGTGRRGICQVALRQASGKSAR